MFERCLSLLFCWFCSMQGVQFQYFYPVNFKAFFAPGNFAKVICLFAMVALIRHGPALLGKVMPDRLLMLTGLFCQLFPLALFYVIVCVGRIPMDVLSQTGWTYPTQGAQSFVSLWTTYSLSDADPSVLLANVPSMLMLMMMSVLCTMTGVLGITGKFPMGPDGDPSPMEVVDFNAELTTVGFGSILTALSNGVVTFHRLGSSIQLRVDGGTHRLAVLTSSCFVGTFFFTSLPLGHYIPKFFLGGLFMGSGISFLEGAFLSFRSLPPQRFRSDWSDWVGLSPSGLRGGVGKGAGKGWESSATLEGIVQRPLPGATGCPPRSIGLLWPASWWRPALHHSRALARAWC